MKFFIVKNLIQIYTKTHQNAPFIKNFSGGGMPPNPPSKAHGFAMRSMLLRDMQISKSQKKILAPPPLPNPGDAPVYVSTVCGYCMCLVGYRPPVLIIFFYKIYSLCKSNAISKALNKLQVFHFRSTVHTNTTPTVITHSCVLQKPPSCNDKGYKFE